jgi:glucosamine-phosphate N-acetyltransferase
MEDYYIRDLRTDDYNNNYLGLLGQLYNMTDISEEFFNKQLDNIKKKTNYYIRVIEQKSTGKIVATGCVFIEFKFAFNLGKVAYVDDIVVDEKYRNQGLGKMLVSHLKRLAMANGVVIMNVIASEKHFTFFRSLGFSEDKNHYSIKL